VVVQDGQRDDQIIGANAERREQQIGGIGAPGSAAVGDGLVQRIDHQVGSVDSIQRGKRLTDRIGWVIRQQRNAQEDRQDQQAQGKQIGSQVSILKHGHDLLLLQQSGSVSPVGSVPGSSPSRGAGDNRPTRVPTRIRRLRFDFDDFTGRRLSVGVSVPNRIPFCLV